MSGIPEQAVPGEHGSGVGQWWVCGLIGRGAGQGALNKGGCIVASRSLSWSSVVALEEDSVTFTGCDLSIHHTGLLGCLSNRSCPNEYN